MFLLKFRKWFKNGLKAQKLLAQGAWGLHDSICPLPFPSVGDRWLIFRLGGTGLWLTEEVEDVGDLHRGELLAVLAVTGGGELLEKVGDALDPSHQVSTGYRWSSIGKIQKS